MSCGGGSGSGEGTGSRSTLSEGWAGGVELRCCGDAGAAAGCCAMDGKAANSTSIAIAKPMEAPGSLSSLLRRCIVPLAKVYGQLRQTRRGQKSYLQFTPVSIVLHL